MPRSIWKGPFFDYFLLKKVKDNKKGKVINTYSRRSTIIPPFIGERFGIYNGRKFIPVTVTEEMVGFKFGEFSPTRTYYGHGADKKAKRN